jgi:hypothetical protein
MPRCRRTPVSWLLAATLVAVSSAGCEYLENFGQPSGLAIQRFVATPDEVAAGSTTTLSWDVEGAETIGIDQGVGEVPGSGSRQIQPLTTTSYTLTARAGTSSATATVQVVVQGSSPTPTPTATPTPTPTPEPSPTPSPSPSPEPSPTASPSPTPVSCGTAAPPPGDCVLSISKPNALPGGECIELTMLTVNQVCPVGVNTMRSLSFDVTAHTSRANLTWRRSQESSDVLQPASGAIASNGTTSVLTSDLVLDSSVTIEVVSGGDVLLSFNLRHY